MPSLFLKLCAPKDAMRGAAELALQSEWARGVVACCVRARLCAPKGAVRGAAELALQSESGFAGFCWAKEIV